MYSASPGQPADPAAEVSGPTAAAAVSKHSVMVPRRRNAMTTQTREPVLVLRRVLAR